MSIATIRTFNGADFSANNIGRYINPIVPHADGLIAASVFGGTLAASLAPISEGRPFEVATGSAVASSRDMTMQGVIRLNPSLAVSGNFTIMSVVKPSVARDTIIGGGLGAATIQMLGLRVGGRAVAISQLSNVPTTAEYAIELDRDYEFIAAIFNKDLGTVSIYVPRTNSWVQVSALISTSGSAYRICSYTIDTEVAYSGPNTQAFHSVNAVALTKAEIDAVYASVKGYVIERSDPISI